MYLMAPEITFLVSSLNASDLRRAGLSVHSARLIKEVPTLGELGTPECSLPWQEELANVERALAASREGVEGQDPNITEGYQQLFVDLYRWSRTPLEEYREKLEKFAQDVLEVLGKSLGVNKGLEQRPAFQNAKGGGTRYTVYKALGASTLNPRELRFIMYNYGLAGTKKSEPQLQVMEGISRLNRMKANGKWNLIWGLSSLQDERRKTQPQTG